MLELKCINDRWHLGDREIHNGTFMELQWPDGTWEIVRVECNRAENELCAHFYYHGEELVVRVDTPDSIRRLRWCKGN